MCQFVEIKVGDKVVSVDQVDCHNPACPASDSNPNNK